MNKRPSPTPRRTLSPGGEETLARQGLTGKREFRISLSTREQTWAFRAAPSSLRSPTPAGLPLEKASEPCTQEVDGSDSEHRPLGCCLLRSPSRLTSSLSSHQLQPFHLVKKRARPVSSSYANGVRLAIPPTSRWGWGSRSICGLPSSLKNKTDRSQHG